MSPIRCSICTTEFRRQEHLTRHMRIHTREKPYQCSLCEKRFARPDVLSRHLASHEEQESAPPAMASSRACRQCALDRVRCSRGHPCKKCAERELPCRYPTSRRQRGRLASSDSSGQQQDMAMTFDSQYADGTTALAPPLHSHPSLPAAGNPPAQISPWLDTFGDVDLGFPPQSLYGLNQPGLGISSVNWMSPQNDQVPDWNTQLASFSFAQNNPDVQSSIFPFLFNAGMLPMHVEQEPSLHQQNQVLRPPDQERTDAVSAAPNHSLGDSVSSSMSTDGRFYVDGTGARAPFGGQSHNRHSFGSVDAVHRDDDSRSESPQALENSDMDVLCPLVAYENLLRALQAECHSHALQVDLARFPSHREIQTYVGHYFDSFHSVFPLLRRRSFTDDACREYLLLLAVSLVGSRYVRRLEGNTTGDMISYLLNTILQRCNYGVGVRGSTRDLDVPFIPGQHAQQPAGPTLQVLQAGILNIICSLHSGKKTLVERAFLDRHYLVEACQSLNLISKSPPEDGLDDRTHYNVQDFLPKWLARESEIRTGMMIWLLDSMFSYEFDSRPLMQLDDIRSMLPSREAVWETPETAYVGKNPFCQTTLPGALEILYMEKRVPLDLCEFSIGLVINAIYRNTKQILAKDQIRLNSWTPTATAQRRFEQSSDYGANNWLPATAMASKWRNSACDCLDVLHWPANSKIARHTGVEHHTILHLHLSRLIILAPTTDIQTFVTYSSSSNQQLGNPSERKRYADARNQVLQWVVRDGFKARLSIIHCGALFWHVRRYSCDSVMEPYAIYISSLLLWAYSVSVQFIGHGANTSIANQEDPSASSAIRESAFPENEEEPDPRFLHLDRPLDDELVQIYVRLGHRMSAYISRVGDIQDRGAPVKILKEGISLLNRSAHMDSDGPQVASEIHCYTWGIEASFVESLNRLLRATNSQ